MAQKYLDITGLGTLWNIIKNALNLKADKTTSVSDINYDSTNSKITKTINGVTSDIVTTVTLKTAMNINESAWKNKKVCFFGDSIGYGYNNNAYSFVDILNERDVFASVHKNCVSGTTTATLAARLQESATEVAEADIVYCEYQANDIVGIKAGSLTLTSIENTVRNCTSAIRNANPTCTIVWMPLTIYHFDKISSTDAIYYKQWAEALYPVFAELSINLLPVYDNLLTGHTSNDGTHPNTAGHQIIADIVEQTPLGISNYPTTLLTEWTGGSY